MKGVTNRREFSMQFANSRASLLVQTGYWPLSFNVPFKTFTLKPKFLQMLFRQSMRPKPKSLNPKSETPKSLRPMPYLEAQGTW